MIVEHTLRLALDSKQEETRKSEKGAISPRYMTGFIH